MELSDSSQSVPENQATLEIKLYDKQIKIINFPYWSQAHNTAEFVFLTYFSYLRESWERKGFKQNTFILGVHGVLFNRTLKILRANFLEDVFSIIKLFSVM